MMKRIVLTILYTFCISMFSYGLNTRSGINQSGSLPIPQMTAIPLGKDCLNQAHSTTLKAHRIDYACHPNSKPVPCTTSPSCLFPGKQHENDPDKTTDHNQYTCGGITRTDPNKKQISLIFSGHEFADGYKIVRSTLKKLNIKAAFFFTGDFYRNPGNQSIIKGLLKDRHYLGGHSDKHLLYCSWQKRDSLLVSKTTFLSDIKANYQEMEESGILKSQAPFYLPSFEWYNDSISQWCKEFGLQVINYTPGTLSNGDYTIPVKGEKYYSSDEIYKRIMLVESKQGLNGNIMLFHLGTDKRRVDKFYPRLDALLQELLKAGYVFTDLYQSTGIVDKSVNQSGRKQKRKN